MTFLLDSDCIEVAGMPCDDTLATSMASQSFALLCALNEARGLPAPQAALRPKPGRYRDYIFVRSLTPADTQNLFKSRFDLVPRMIDSVASDFGITHGELIGEGRSKLFVHARAVVVRLLLDRGYSAASIGKRYLRRDHSSILHSRDHFDVYARVNPMMDESYHRHAEMMREAAQ